jgi:hypothetical protein
MESFGNIPLLSRVHPDLKEAQSKVVRHFQRAYNIPVEKVLDIELIKENMANTLFCVGRII